MRPVRRSGLAGASRAPQGRGRTPPGQSAACWAGAAACWAPAAPTARAAWTSAAVWAVKHSAVTIVPSSTDSPPRGRGGAMRDGPFMASSAALAHTSPTLPSARSMAGRPSCGEAPQASDSTLATLGAGAHALGGGTGCAAALGHVDVVRSSAQRWPPQALQASSMASRARAPRTTAAWAPGALAARAADVAGLLPGLGRGAALEWARPGRPCGRMAGWAWLPRRRSRCSARAVRAATARGAYGHGLRGPHV